RATSATSGSLRCVFCAAVHRRDGETQRLRGDKTGLRQYSVALFVRIACAIRHDVIVASFKRRKRKWQTIKFAFVARNNSPPNSYNNQLQATASVRNAG